MPDAVSGCRLCRRHQAEGLVTAEDALIFLKIALPASWSVQELVEGLFSSCAGGALSLHNGLGARGSGLLSDDALTAVEAACKAELDRRLTVPVSDLTQCVAVLNTGLPPSAPELLLPSADSEVAAEREAVRRELDKQAQHERWEKLGPAQRSQYSTASFATIKGDLQGHAASAAARGT